MGSEAERRQAGGISEAAREVVAEDAARAREARSDLARIRRLILRTDAMLDELEHENLREVGRVSPAWGPRMSLLLSSLPAGDRPPIRALRTPSEVLDLVYDVQERLFDLKSRQLSPLDH